MRTKTFDAVKLMRDLRDKLSKDMEHMTAEERMRYIRGKAASTRLGREIGEDKGDSAGQADAADDASRRR
jgi:hypothetical protein